MSAAVSLAGNLVIAVAYAAITVAILRPVARSGQLRTNRLATATALIFFSCAVGHAFHAIAAGEAVTGLSAGHPAHAAGTWSLWPSAFWDLFTAAVGVYYWTLRRTYGVLLGGGGALFVDAAEDLRRTEIELRERIAESRAAAEAERDAQAAMLRAVIDSSQSLIYVKDLEGRFLVVNTAFEQLFGVSEAELLGHTDTDLDPEGAAAWQANDRRAREETIRVEERAVDPDDGQERIFESVKFPLHDAEGRTYAVCGVSLDVTELRRAVRAAEEARDEALVQSRAKSQFLASMSHEIRTPMNGVIGLSDLLLRTELDDLQHRYADGIHTAGRALLDVINDILDFSKIEAGRLALEVGDVDLPELLSDVVAIIEPSAQGRGLEVASRVPPDLPQIVRGDGARLRQVLVNLAGNAVKFTASGWVMLAADVVRDDTGAPVDEPDADLVRVRFSVSDTGIGIAAGDVARLFEPFTQADASTTRRFGGTGLGLSICRELVEAMGGAIDVLSTPGVGSTFTFTVPLGRTEERAAAPPPPGPTADAEPAPAPAPAVVAGEGPRVLLVEDNEINRLVAVGILTRLGYRHDVAADGVEALGLAARNHYDAVLMDCQMPRMDGYTATGELRRREADGRHMPIIAMTASVQLSDRERCIAAGMDDYVGKPVDPDALEATLRRWTTAVPRPAVPAPRSGTRRVLLAEDNAINAKVAAHSLRRLGYEVDVVGDGRAALDALAAHRYDAVLMDCEMPVLDGYAATREFRRAEPEGRHTPIIALTASAMAADRERCLAAGMDDHLAKPVWEEHLAAALRRLAGLEGGPGAPPADDGGTRRELTHAFLATMAPRLEELDNRLREGAAEDVVALTHDLRSTSVAVGAYHLAELLTEVEDIARSRPADLPGVADSLAAEHCRVVGELREFVS